MAIYRQLFPYPTHYNWDLLKTQLKALSFVIDANDVNGEIGVYKDLESSFSSEQVDQIEAVLAAHDFEEQTLYQKIELDLPSSRSLFETLMNMTPSEVGEWVETNVTDLATAKNVLIKIAMLEVYLLHKVEGVK